MSSPDPLGTRHSPLGTQSCPCCRAPLRYDRYDEVAFLGVDATAGRYGEVSLLRCKACGQYWLRYALEYEHLAASGRFFLGPIAPQVARGVAPEAAVEYLESLDWYLFGGSYFRGAGRSSGGPLPLS
jgi:hypothetical protein